MSNHNSMLQLDVLIRTPRWKRVINMSTSFHGTPQRSIMVESPNKRAKLSTCVDNDHQLSRTEDHGEGHVNM
jgi:hypothetical protein